MGSFERQGQAITTETPMNPLPTQLGETRTDARPYNQMQLLFMLRLASLLRRRREYQHVLVPTDWRMRLLHKSIYSTFCDCMALGIGGEARGLFQDGELAD